MRVDLSVGIAKKVLSYHRSLPNFAATPLSNLYNLGVHLGIKGFFVKDESYRLGLNAFKVLGAGYAMGKWMGAKLGIPDEELSFERLTTPEAAKQLGTVTFVSATDGNHGRGVAWTAQQMGHEAVIYMPKGTAAERLENIRACGAKAEILPMNYDECVDKAAADAKKYGWVLVQDTAFEGYEEVPTWIMQGYLTMALEAAGQLEGVVPTHVFLQAGVGSMPGAVAGLMADYYGEEKPTVVIVEPNKASCVYQTAAAGSIQTVSGDMDTIMAGLACGRPNPVAWDVLAQTTEFAVSCPDWVAAHGMRVLGNPLKGDPRIISGESGAVTAGLMTALMQREDLVWLRNRLHLNKDSVILCFSTEGDTDMQNYRSIVWDGKYPNAE
ncbi:MAG: diaminopropionate ammonia-lyase [Eubacteriales bacterium]|nr:diaminopropionate ammonia-lyase [Eubacteriales bacterium]MDD4104649.1 diaminopropionate ammonia-lyase [Eubacteriales bacterium]MDD4710803.1 diaminopropionate ammonia-lyase [Eubacteriales bacterium]